ncbi:MAG: hypothetical protein IPG04_16185 [Polyangiaceae bacterium]|nr:hypothetical protein [Polyangiaceae bacterium]
MTALPFVFAGLVILIGAVTWRPHGWGPAVGAAAAVLAASLGGAVELGDPAPRAGRNGRPSSRSPRSWP